jgi:hypothetical protein
LAEQQQQQPVLPPDSTLTMTLYHDHVTAGPADAGPAGNGKRFLPCNRRDGKPAGSTGNDKDFYANPVQVY